MAFAGITDGPDAVHDNHSLFRNGSYWQCKRGCGERWPFPMPASGVTGPCVPRRWGDEEDPIVRECKRCGAQPGERCYDLRTVMARMDKRHEER